MSVSLNPVAGVVPVDAAYAPSPSLGSPTLGPPTVGSPGLGSPSLGSSSLGSPTLVSPSLVPRALVSRALVSPTLGASHEMTVSSVIVGGGPAGVAPLIAASHRGSLAHILAGGLAIVERGHAIGIGSIGRYAINSDSTADTFMTAVRNNPHPFLSRLQGHPAVEAVASYGRGPVPLRLVGEFMAVVGAALHDSVAATPGTAVLLGHEAVHTTQAHDGLWRTKLRRVSDGVTRTILSRLVIVATGGHQPRPLLRRQRVAGEPLLPRFAGKLLRSGEVLTAAGLDAIGHRLAASRHKRVAIIGGASSAVACAHALLHSRYGSQFGTGAVTVLHRRPLRVFYPSADAARSEGYDEFGPDDICPVSGFVFRFAGFRLESRELVMAVRGIGGRPAEKRLRLHQLEMGPDPAALAILEEADVIVSALGYRPRALPVLAASGRPIRLFASGPGGRPLVDGRCRILDAAGKPIPGLLGIGLAAGFKSAEAVGGEPSFTGQTNGLWQWQNDIGAIIAQSMQAHCMQESARNEPALML